MTCCPRPQIAHRNGIRVFAWMTTRYADYGIEGAMVCASYDINRETQPAAKGLDLFSDEAVSRLERLYADLAAYEIDGVLFQDDLVLRHNPGLRLLRHQEPLRGIPESVSTPRLLCNKGRGAGPGPLHTRPGCTWSAARTGGSLPWPKRLMHTVKRRGLEAMSAINLMYESVTNPSYALAWLSQDIGEAKKADFDYYSIMAYHRQMGQELQKDGTA